MKEITQYRRLKIQIASLRQASRITIKMLITKIASRNSSFMLSSFDGSLEAASFALGYKTTETSDPMFEQINSTCRTIMKMNEVPLHALYIENA